MRPIDADVLLAELENSHKPLPDNPSVYAQGTRNGYNLAVNQLIMSVNHAPTLPAEKTKCDTISLEAAMKEPRAWAIVAAAEPSRAVDTRMTYSDLKDVVHWIDEGCKMPLDELGWIKSFLSEVVDAGCLGDEREIELLRMFWTVYCFHERIECDTLRYDNELLELWEIIEDAGEKPFLSLRDFDAFDLMMGEYLC